ncbi:hypothetical protein TKK_0019469 [Trichogramma kaykai]|uniref:Uncharacterized protein n=1 Tax=Trichogramma kaykai TaxID=54128 RepID=A0ABD2VTT4_9HYME
MERKNSLLLISLIVLFSLARPNNARSLQILPEIPGYVPVYIRLGDQPLEEINPALAEAFHETPAEVQQAENSRSARSDDRAEPAAPTTTSAPITTTTGASSIVSTKQELSSFDDDWFNSKELGADDFGPSSTTEEPKPIDLMPEKPIERESVIMKIPRRGQTTTTIPSKLFAAKKR